MTENQSLRAEGPGEPPLPAVDPWRKEIHARLAGYRKRRGRRIEGAFSMRFPFPESAAQERTEERSDPQGGVVAESEKPDSVGLLQTADEADLVPLVPASASEADSRKGDFATAITESELAVAANIEPPTPAAPTRPRPRRKVIAFPRPAHEIVEARYRLADPVLPEEPRIMDVPEELEALPTTPFLEGLHFGPDPVVSPTRVDEEVDLLFHPARIARRVHAAMIDCAVVTVATSVFVAAGWKVLPKLVVSKPVILAAAAMPLLLWATYQYVLLVYGGKTLGVRMMRLRLATFRGSTPRFRARRNRVLGLYFSVASLAMGLLWALVDVDGLCWHDRISGTYLVEQSQEENSSK